MLPPALTPELIFELALFSQNTCEIWSSMISSETVAGTDERPAPQEKPGLSEAGQQAQNPSSEALNTQAKLPFKIFREAFPESFQFPSQICGGA
jgi:hypothetical protein